LKASSWLKLFSPGRILAHLKTIYFRLTIKPSEDFDKNVIYKMVWDRRPILKIFNDKTESLKYVKELIPDIKYPHRYYETSDVDSINWNDLPENFVCKMSHGSGGVILVHKNAPAENILPKYPKRFGWKRLEIRPDMCDLGDLNRILKNLLGKTYGMGINRRYPEWAYWGIVPRVIVEDFLSLNGKMPRRLALNIVRGELTQFYSDQLFYPGLNSRIVLNEKTFGGNTHFASIAQEVNIPRESVELIIKNSILIAGDLDYLRVDWLVTDEEIYFNELTNYCGGGRLKGSSYYSHMSQMWRPKRSDYR